MAKTSKNVDLIVRRGALWRFHKLSEKTAHLPVNVMWDRRRDDRRSASDGAGATNRRKKERRREPPFTWELSSFVVATKPLTRKKRKRR